MSLALCFVRACANTREQGYDEDHGLTGGTGDSDIHISNCGSDDSILTQSKLLLILAEILTE